MKKSSIFKKFITIVLISLLLTSCGGKEVENNDSSTGAKQNQVSQNIKNDENEEDDQNLLDQFFDNGIGNLKCVTHIEQEDGVTDQTIYLSGDKVRIDFIVTNNDNTTIENHVINDGEYSYNWGPQGAYKMKIEDDLSYDDINTENEDMDISVNESDYVDYPSNLDEAMEQMTDTNCKKWDVDNSVFKVPSGIVFQDMEQMLQELENNFQNFDMEQFQNMMQNNMQ
ncbi:MAG: hypothetical protein PHH06_00925 [Candidatus Gracilibacteria bacterium]|nr:hypothetical protein [Candidatus Gracilibacteria bacterium]